MHKKFLVLSLVLIFNAVFNAQTAQIRNQPESLPQQIARVAKQRGISVRLFYNLIAQESNGNLNARSSKGAVCLTQLMPDTARRFGLRVNQQVDERYDPEKCLQAGATYLAWLLNAFRGDVRLALAGYNAGEGAVIKYGYRIPPYRQTVEYVEKICYRTYGQSGHGVAMAYDRTSAYNWTANLYTNRRPPQNTPFPVNQTVESELLPANSDVDAAATSPGNPPNNVQKPKISRLANDSIQPKIRTESLYFWKQSN